MMERHTQESLLESFERFCSDNGSFKLNPDKEHVDFVIDGLFANEKAHGLKLCPCRLRDGSKERDLELICPCNFFSQKTYIEEGRCWCGLFVKK
ncbi:MAG: ferredoxin-thioredoxin reductase catalytic domain-containing protein [Nanoarchaeota archaeon]|nr:ferredoxin-thioredoxin reductase catalytic domain-containing protein [Nanoarchaeota archaeon]